MKPPSSATALLSFGEPFTYSRLSHERLRVNHVDGLVTVPTVNKKIAIDRQ